MTPKPTAEEAASFAEAIGFRLCGDQELLKAVTACLEWKNAVAGARTPRWLSLVGGSGTGKTFLATHLWRLVRRDFDWSRCEYCERAVYWPDFVQKLRGGGAYDRRNDMKRWPLLFLDDVGAERDPSGFATEELLNNHNERNIQHV